MLGAKLIVKVLLIGKEQDSSPKIESCLASIQSYEILLSKIKDADNIASSIYQYHPDLILYISDQKKDCCRDSFRSEAEIPNSIPIIFLLPDYPEEKILSGNVDEYLPIAEISAFLLERSICTVFERLGHYKQLEFITLENAELSSQLLTTKNLFQTIVDSSSTLIWMCNAVGKTTYFNQAWS
ncbi:MAG: hypothetical protein AAFO95_21575, partial [Cyanobacteria bacterium J06600_6]